MFFKNLTIFRFPASLQGLFPGSTADELDSLEQRLAENPLKPCGPMELASRGFVPPLGRAGEQLVHRLGDFAWIALGGEDKILPPAVVNAALAKKLAEVERREGRSPGARARKRMKEDVVAELLPRAFTKPGRCDAYFDFERGLLLVDTSTRKRAEQVVSEIRHALGSFPALPANAETAPRAVLTGWLAGEALPDGLALGESCVLEDPYEGGARITVRNLDLASDDLAAHLSAGMQCTRLALVLDDHVAFEFDEDLTVRKLQFLDGALDSMEGTERDDLLAELDARFALMTGEVARLFDLLEEAFQLTVPVDEDPSFTEQGAPEKPRAGAAGITMAEHIAAVSRDEADPLYDQAVEYVRDNDHASISRVQRIFKIGYNRAARLIERMEAEGVVSAPAAQGDRTVLRPGALH